MLNDLLRNVEYLNLSSFFSFLLSYAVTFWYELLVVHAHVYIYSIIISPFTVNKIHLFWCLLNICSVKHWTQHPSTSAVVCVRSPTRWTVQVYASTYMQPRGSSWLHFSYAFYCNFSFCFTFLLRQVLSSCKPILPCYFLFYTVFLSYETSHVKFSVSNLAMKWD